MNAHRFDPLSAVLGLAATSVGTAVILGADDALWDADSGAWIAGLVLVAGLALFPWGRRRSD